MAATEPEVSARTEAPFRLPWPAVFAALIAFAALFTTEGGSIALPLFGAAVVASRFARFRLGDQLTQFGPLLGALFGMAFLSSALHPAANTDGMFDTQRTALFGEMCAALLVMECWRARPDAGGQGVITLLLSGLVLWAATNTFNDLFVRFLAPAYVLCVALALPHFRSAAEPAPSPAGPVMEHQQRPNASRGASAARFVALALAFAIGMVSYTILHDYRMELTAWGMRLLNETPHGEIHTTGLERTPMLGPGYGLAGTLDRVLRIEGSVQEPHLRGLSYDSYERGRWGPSRESRRYRVADVARFRGAGTSPFNRVTRLEENDGMLFAPLSAVGIDLSGNGDVEWAGAEGGPLHTSLPAPSTYGYRDWEGGAPPVPRDALLHDRVRALANEGDDHQGPLCQPPDATERARLLAIPPELDPRVRPIAAAAVADRGTGASPVTESTSTRWHGHPNRNAHTSGDATSPLAKARAIESYLMRSHDYSLWFDPGSGDPVSSFLLSRRAAHCEYFGSAAVMLLRCAGIPARYVTGYYAHEGDGANVTIVRERDAHAWAEAWIDGLGWITIDATPGDGRPDRAGETVPAWRRAWEWLQDAYAAATSRLTGKHALYIALACAALALPALFWQRRGKPRTTTAAPFAYALPAPELQALMRRFEQLCRRSGLVCPPDQTWQEYLATARSSPALRGRGDDRDALRKEYLAAAGSSPADAQVQTEHGLKVNTAARSSAPTRIDTERALAFVEQYNAVRFGQPSATALADLTRLLEACVTRAGRS